MNLHFDSTHNFRQVYPFGVQESDQDETGQIGNLYRSSRPDFMEDHEVEKLQTLGVKTIIDLRSTAEYKKASGHKRLDQKYKVREVLLPEKGQKYKPGEKISWKPVNAVKETTDDEEDQYHHYLINFFNFNFISTLFLRLPWYMKIYGVLVTVYDLLLGTHLLYFSRIMFRYAVNDQGLIGQYIDMAELSNTAICSALKLLTDDRNLPAMINCAYGKDRTGIVVALVLSCLGRQRDEICKDYALSEVCLAPLYGRMYQETVERHHIQESFLTAKVETMAGFLDYLDNKYGSVPNYLESIGFGQEEQQKLQNTLRSGQQQCLMDI